MIRFEGSRKVTRVTIRLPADADYERDSDSEWIEAWLKRQKFRIEEPDITDRIVRNDRAVASAT